MGSHLVRRECVFADRVLSEQVLHTLSYIQITTMQHLLARNLQFVMLLQGNKPKVPLEYLCNFKKLLNINLEANSLIFCHYALKNSYISKVFDLAIFFFQTAHCT